MLISFIFPFNGHHVRDGEHNFDITGIEASTYAYAYFAITYVYKSYLIRYPLQQTVLSKFIL